MLIIGHVGSDNFHLGEPGQYGYGVNLQNPSTTTMNLMTEFMNTMPDAQGNAPLPGKTPFGRDDSSFKINCYIDDVYAKTADSNTQPVRPFPNVKDARLAVELSSSGPVNPVSCGSKICIGQLVAVAAHLKAYQPDKKNKPAEWGYALKLHSVLILEGAEDDKNEENEDEFSF
jgi:hypothetical protein